jgi:hypothetical protein
MFVQQTKNLSVADRLVIQKCRNKSNFIAFDNIAIETTSSGTALVASLHGQRDTLAFCNHKDTQFVGPAFVKLYDAARNFEAAAPLSKVSFSADREALMFSLGARCPRFVPTGIIKSTALSREGTAQDLVQELLFGEATQIVDKASLCFLPERTIANMEAVKSGLKYTRVDGHSISRSSLRCASPVFSAWQWTKKTDTSENAEEHPIHFDADHPGGVTFVHSIGFGAHGTTLTNEINAQFDLFVRMQGDSDACIRSNSDVASFGAFVKVSCLLTSETPLAFAAALVAHRAIPPPGVGVLPGVISSMDKRRSSIWYTNKKIRNPELQCAPAIANRDQSAASIARSKQLFDIYATSFNELTA